MKKLLTIALMLGMGSMVWANGLSLNSIGTRAMGMGGAYVGYAADASAIYWNPAGLAGQESNIIFYGSGIMPSGSYKFDGTAIGQGAFDADMVSNTYFTGGLFLNYNMDKMAFGLGIYVPAGLGAEWDNVNMTAGQKLMSNVGAVSISPTFAYQVSKKFSVGIAVNILYAMFDMDRPVAAPAGLGLNPAYLYSESSTGLGYGATIGLKYDATKDLSVGATIRLASTVAMSGDADNGMFPALPSIPGVVAPGPKTSSFDRDITWPLWVAGGVAYKGIKNLVITADLQYSQWSELQELVTKYDDPYWNAALAPANPGDEDNRNLTLKWDDAIQYRVGAEYMMSKAMALRLGYYYDPAPSPDETLTPLFPSSTNNALTGGFSYYADKITVNVAVEYLLGGDREVTTEAAPGYSYKETHHLDVLALGLGVSYAF